MKTLYLLAVLSLAFFPAEAQLVPCRPKICLIDYNYHNDIFANADKTAIQSAKPDILIDNTPGGYWGHINFGTGCLPPQYTTLGIKVFSYITGGYEGTRVYTDPTEDDLTSNLLRVDAIAVDHATGVFLDNVSHHPDSAAKVYISAIYNECLAKGLQLILNPGVYDFDSWLMDHCTYLMSDEVYDGTRPLSPSEIPYANRILVVTQGITTPSGAAVVTEGARAHGFGYSYACSTYLAIPTWLSSYLTMVTHAYAGTITGTSSVCATSNITLADTTSGGVWSSNITAIAGVGSSGVVTGVSAGTVNISYTVTCGTSTVAASKNITVNPLPVASTITGTSSVCEGASIILSDITAGGSWSSSTPSIAIVGSTGIVSGISAGNATTIYSVTNSCGTAVAMQIVTVNPLPNAGSITGAATVCVSATTTLTDVVLGGIWSSSTPSIATVGSTGIVSGISAGTATISYSVTNSCATAVAIKNVTVNPLPNAGSIGGTATVCASATTTLSDVVSGGIWSSSTPSIATVSGTGVVTGILVGTAIISYSVTNSCGTADAVQIVTVNPLPNAGSITGATTVCESATTTLSDVVLGGTWNSSTSSIATVGSTGIVSGISAGTATISYSVTNSCGTAVATQIVTVNPLPNAGSITGVATVCESATTTLSDVVFGGTWSSSTSSIATVSSTGILSGISAGTATISYSVTNGCGTAVAMQIVTVNPLPNAGSITGATTVCESATTTLSDVVLGGTWSSSTPSIATVDSTGIVSGISAGTATISYSVTNICGTGAATINVTVDQLPDAGSVTGGNNVCETDTITLSNSIIGGIWSTSNGNASISITGVVTGITAGTTIISYTVTNSCGSALALSTINVIASSLCLTSNNSLQLDPKAIKIFPNPSNGRFTVDLINLSNANIEITDLLGRILINENIPNKALIDLSDKGNGIYFIKIAAPYYIHTKIITIDK